MTPMGDVFQRYVRTKILYERDAMLAAPSAGEISGPRSMESEVKCIPLDSVGAPRAPSPLWPDTFERDWVAPPVVSITRMIPKA